MLWPNVFFSSKKNAFWSTEASFKDMTPSSQKSSIFPKESVGEPFTTARATLRVETAPPPQIRPDFLKFASTGGGKKLSNFQNRNFLKMHDIHTKLVSSLFKLYWWPSSQKSSKLSWKFKFDIDISARAPPRALRAVFPIPCRCKFQKFWSGLGRGRGFRAQVARARFWNVHQWILWEK